MSAETKLARILEDLKELCDWSYKQGFHELGYDPVQDIGDFARIAIAELVIVEAEIGVPSKALQLLKGEA